MPVKKKVSEPVEEKPLGIYQVSIEQNGTVFTTDGDDMEEILISFQPTVIKTRTMLIVERDGRKITKFLPIPQARRIFFTKNGAKFYSINIIKALA